MVGPGIRFPRRLAAFLIPLALYAAAAPAAADDPRLHAIFAGYWQWVSEQVPEWATFRGDNRYNDRLSDVSATAVQVRRQFRENLLERLKDIDRAQLAGQDRISYDVLVHDLKDAARFYAAYGELPFGPGLFEDTWSPLTQFDGPQFALPQLMDATPFRNVNDYENYLKRLAQVPRFLGQLRERMQLAMHTGWLPPGVPLERVPGQLDAFLVADVTKVPLYRPFQRFPPDVPAEQQERLTRAARQVLSEQVVPAFREMKAFYESDYLPAARARPGIGLSQLPGGAQLYRLLIADITTTSMTAQEVHDLGLREVARLDHEIDQVIRRTGFAGSREQFVKYLHEAPRFYYATGDELLAGYRDIAKRADAELPKLFVELPRTPYGVRAAEPFEGDNADHYIDGAGDGSRAGYFVANVNNVKTRPKYDMEDLVLHEAVPGHHLQISRAQEIKDLPEFRRYAFYVAYAEGWALYAESLGEQMGFYRDPYSKFGQLSGEIWRACRLVVDTGIHAFGWTRDQAIDYMMQHALLSHDYAVAEVDRYIVLPGQALGYKIGELKIKALRDRARAALGERFDLRRFNNAVIDDGPLPLDVLEQRIDEWIAAQKQASQ